MSKFCGKCDLYDCEVMIHGENNPNYWKNLDLYKYNNESKSREKIEITCAKDLVLYYPFIEFFSGCSDNYRTVEIGNLSFITEENYEMLEIYKKQFIRYYNKCKRNKIEYDSSNAFNEIVNDSRRSDLLILAERVKEKKNKADYKDLVWSPMVNYYRELWKSEIINFGYTEEFADKWVREH